MTIFLDIWVYLCIMGFSFFCSTHWQRSMDKARVTVVAAHRFQAGQAGFTGTDLSSNQQQEANKVDADREEMSAEVVTTLECW